MFVSPVRVPFQNPFPTEGAAAAESWWLSGGISAGDCAAAYQAKGAASLAASYSNLNNPGTYDLAPGVAPTWSGADGWSFNASSMYLKAGYIPSSDNISIIIKFSNSGASETIITGFGGAGTKRINIRPQGGGSTRKYLSGGISTLSPNATSGVIGISGKQPYLDGVSDGPAIVGNNTTWIEMYIGAANISEGPAAWFDGKIQAIAFYETIITADQNLAVANAMNLL